MELISKLEKEKRGIYGGAVGYFSFHRGDIDTCIAIRTLMAKDGVAYLQAGGGIVYDSNPEDEYQETVNKMAAVGKAIQLAEERTTSEIKRTQNGKPITHSSIEFNALFEHLKGFNLPSFQFQQRDKTMERGKLLLIDNYDSFTWNLYQYLCQLGEDVVVYRNDAITVEECEALQPKRVVISPGPSWPKDAGISNDIIRAFAGKVPVLGVCLGHECLVTVYGGEIVHAGEIVHGKTSVISHDGKGVFVDIPNNIQVIRYHSLAANVKNLPDELIVTSQTANGIIMGLRHKKYKVEGVQFHPESIKTEYGMEMLRNFIREEGGHW